MAGDLWRMFLAGGSERLDEIEACLTQPSCWKDKGPAWVSEQFAVLEAEAWCVGADALALAVRTARQALGHFARNEDGRGVILAFLDELRKVLQNLGRDESLDAVRLVEGLEQAAAHLTELGAEERPGTKTTSQKQTGQQTFSWNPPEDERMVEAFVQECSERLENLGTKLLDLEDASEPRPLLAEIFRDMHTLKGSSAFVRLTPLNELAHAAEDLLGSLKKAGLVSRAHIDSLLAVTDVMGEVLELARQGQPIAADRVGQAIERLARPVTKDMAEARRPDRPMPAREKSPRQVGQTIRVDFEKLDSLLNLVGEQVVLKASMRGLESQQEKLAPRLEAIARLLLESGPDSLDAQELHERIDAEVRGSRELARKFDELLGKLEFSVAKLRDQVMQLRMIPVSRIFSKHRRTVRDLSESLGKSVRLELVGETTELDKILVEKLDEPLVHLVRNALDHGIESPQERTDAGKDPVATLRLSASHRGSQFLIQVSDDGRGIDPSRVRRRAVEKGLLSAQDADLLDDKASLELLFAPGMSTASKVTELSGRGVGLDVVAQVARSLRGAVSISSRPGKGTTFTVTVPLTLAIRQVLLLDVAGRRLAIPLESVSRTTRVSASQIRRAGRGLVFGTDPAIFVLDLAHVLGLTSHRTQVSHLAVVDQGGDLFALTCDDLLGKQEILVKNPESILPDLPLVAGATILDNQVVPILDLPAVVRAGLNYEPAFSQSPQEARRRLKALVVDDSPAARLVVADILSRLGFEITEADDGRAALKQADTIRFDLVATDVNMPEMDGYELTRALRARRKTQSVPIIMISVRGEEIDAVRGFDAGVDAYLSKPVDEAELARTVEKLLSTEGLNG